MNRKIGIFLENYIAGGVDTVIVNKINHWPDENDEIILICNKTHPGLEQILERRTNRPYQVVLIPIATVTDICNSYSKYVPRAILRLLFFFGRYFYGIYASYRLFLILRKLKLDALFIHNGGYPGADFARFLVPSAIISGIRKTTMVVHNLAARSRIVKLPFEFIIDRYIDTNVQFVCVSNASKMSLYKNRFIRNDISVIYNSIPLIEETSCAKRSAVDPMVTSFVRGYKVIIVVGSFEERKGHEVLFKSLQMLIREKKTNNFRCLVVGMGNTNEQSRIKALLEQNHLKNYVLLCGFQENVRDFLNMADIFVLPSIAGESLPMVILEAMSAKLAVVASDVGGVSEMVTDQQSGLIVPAGSSQLLADAIFLLLTNNELRVRLGKNAEATLKSKFDLINMCKQYNQLLD